MLGFACGAVFVATVGRLFPLNVPGFERDVLVALDMIAAALFFIAAKP
jgi:hypothetical protein